MSRRRRRRANAFRETHRMRAAAGTRVGRPTSRQTRRQDGTGRSTHGEPPIARRSGSCLTQSGSPRWHRGDQNRVDPKRGDRCAEDHCYRRRDHGDPHRKRTVLGGTRGGRAGRMVGARCHRSREPHRPRALTASTMRSRGIRIRAAALAAAMVMVGGCDGDAAAHRDRGGGCPLLRSGSPLSPSGRAASTPTARASRCGRSA